VPTVKEHRVLVNNKRHKVKLLKVGKNTPYLVEVDDKAYEVDVSNDLTHGNSTLIKVNSKSYKVEINKFNRDASSHIKVNGRLFKVQYEKMERVFSQTTEMVLPTPIREPMKRLVPEKNVVTAFMPGRVVLLKVKPSDSVKVGDTLCVLESMKMENEITAPKAGVVQEVKVSEGLMVNKGETLMVIQ
jgi:biotin carboxyl carrier protein